MTDCPDFSLPSTIGTLFHLASSPKPLVIYFYPKDNTPGCTTEGMNFRDLYAQFKAAGAEIVGISRDNLASHEKFKAKLGLPFALLADEDESVCKRFDVLKLKTLYGKQSIGIERSTFIVDKQGKIAHEWRKVKVDGHAQEVLEKIKMLA